MPEYLICKNCGYKKNATEDSTCPNCGSRMQSGDGNKNAYFENKMKYPVIDASKCTLCGSCLKNCPVSAIYDDKKTALIAIDKCTNCGRCISVCPEKAITRD